MDLLDILGPLGPLGASKRSPDPPPLSSRTVAVTMTVNVVEGGGRRRGAPWGPWGDRPGRHRLVSHKAPGSTWRLCVQGDSPWTPRTGAPSGCAEEEIGGGGGGEGGGGGVGA
eukprot:2888950-Pyramimonas_sp.AAC.1